VSCENPITALAPARGIDNTIFVHDNTDESTAASKESMRLRVSGLVTGGDDDCKTVAGNNNDVCQDAGDAAVTGSRNRSWLPRGEEDSHHDTSSSLHLQRNDDRFQVLQGFKVSPLLQMWQQRADTATIMMATRAMKQRKQ
jgi:hypothetical protein